MTDRSPLVVSAPRLLYPHVYSMDNYALRFGGRARFCVTFDWSVLPEEIRRSLHPKVRDRELHRAISGFAPMVSEVNGRYADLAAVFAEAEVRNVARDRLLCGPAEVELETFECQLPHTRWPFLGLGLKSLTIDVLDVSRRLSEITAR
jgi:hypothetical protein